MLLGRVRKIAEVHRGECLSRELLGEQPIVKLRCARGHLWEANAYRIAAGAWCVRCNQEDRREIRLNEIREKVAAHGGQCLSQEYCDTRSPLLFECRFGHQWKTNATSIFQGHWCHECSGKKKLELKVAQDLARSRGGECLSTVYANNKKPLRWRCRFGHEWEACIHSTKDAKHWCPICAGNSKGDLDQMHHLAQEQGGRCLSAQYTDSQTALDLECAEGHRWSARPAHIAFGSWCPYCGNAVRSTIERMDLLARANGGRCLSKKYKNNKSGLLWECHLGHQWIATPNAVAKKNGSWCPVCVGKKAKLVLNDPTDEQIDQDAA